MNNDNFGIFALVLVVAAALVAVILVPSIMWGERKEKLQQHNHEQMLACIHDTDRSAADCQYLVYGHGK